MSAAGEPDLVSVPGAAAAAPAARGLQSGAATSFDRWGALLVIVPIAAAAAVHFGITRNYFFSDDFLNLYRIKNESVLRYLLTPHGGHTLLLRNALFFLFARAFDTNPAPYFWIVWLTHLINVALLFSVVRRLTQSARLACFGATLWGVSPLHAGALGWYSVYGHVVAATALLIILNLVVRAGAAQRAPSRRALGVCYALALMATVLFGVGIGFAMALPLVIAWLAPEARRAARWGIPLRSLWLAVPLLYLVLFWLYGRIGSEGLDTPGTLIMLAVKYAVIIPGSLLHLMGYGVMALAMGFALAPEYYSDAAAYAAVAVIVAVGAAIAWRASPQGRRVIAACALSTVACYGIVVLGRVVFFGGYPSTAMATQSRYHYAGLLCLTILLCVLIGQAGSLTRLPAWVKTSALLLWLALLGATYARSGFAIDHHMLAKEQVDKVRAVIAARAAAQPKGAEVFLQNRAFAGFAGGAPPREFPGWAAIFVIFNPDNTVDGRRIRFYATNLGVAVAAARGRRSAGLIVPHVLVPQRNARPRPAAKPPEKR